MRHLASRSKFNTKHANAENHMNDEPPESNKLKRDAEIELSFASAETPHDAAKKVSPANSSAEPIAVSTPNQEIIPKIELSNARRNVILGLLTLWGLIGNLANTIILPALPAIQRDLETSAQAVNTSVTLGTIVNGVLPLFWSAVSDRYGRRNVLVLTGPLMIAASVAGYFAPNIGAFFAIRMVQQAAASASLSTGSGAIADLYPRARISFALGVFFAGFTMGTTIGPAVGGVVAERVGWRWTFVVVAAVAVVSWAGVVAFLQETGKRTDGPKPKLKELLIKPLNSLAYNRYPFVFANVLVMAFSFAELYTMSVTVPRDFPGFYGFSTSQAGFVQLTTGLFMLLGTFFSGRYSDRTYRVWKERRKGVVVPEDRLRATVPAIWIMCSGNLVLGWSLALHGPWPLAAFGACLTGFGLMGFSTSSSAYLIELFPGNASSIIAGANVLRYSLAGLGPLIVAPLQSAVGPGWLWTVLAGVNIAAYVWLFWIAVKGTRWRLGMEPWRGASGAKEQLDALNGGT